MAKLESKSGTIKPSEDCTPRHGRGVDPSSITAPSVKSTAGSAKNMRGD